MTDAFEVQGEFAPAQDTDFAPAPATPNGFVRLGLAPELIRAVEDLGFTEPTSVQDQTIPKGMMADGDGEAGRFIDLMVSRQTGRG